MQNGLHPPERTCLLLRLGRVVLEIHQTDRMLLDQHHMQFDLHPSLHNVLVALPRQLT